MLKTIALVGEHIVRDILEQTYEVAVESGEEYLVSVTTFTETNEFYVVPDTMIKEERLGWVRGHQLGKDLREEITRHITKKIELIPREKTTEEIQEAFLTHCWDMIDYWKNATDVAEDKKYAGIVFSILSALDGNSMALQCLS